MNYNNIVDIVGQIYESIAYDDVWEDVLTNISGILQSTFCYLCITDRQSDQTSIISHHLSDQQKLHYQDQVYRYDQLCESSHQSNTGAIKTRQELNEFGSFINNAAYQAFLDEYSAHHCLSSCFYRDSQFVASILFFRPNSDNNFSNRDKKELGVFIPHLTRAFTISAQTKVANLQAQIQSQIQNTNDAGIFLVMENSIAIPMNNKAFDIISSSSMISLNHDKLKIKHQNTNKRLSELINKCITTAQGKDMFPGGFIRVEPHIDGAHEWHFSVTPYRSGASQNMLRARGALVIIRRTASDNYEKLELILSDFYGLTAAETQVLLKIISGLSTPEISEELNLTKECIRSRLKKIYEKTGVSNQVQLTHNILEGPYKLANMLG